MRRRRFAPSKSLLLALAIIVAATFGASDSHAIKNPMLMGLMKRINYLSAGGDMRATSKLLGMIRSMGPQDMPDWQKHADKARAAAQRGDRDGMKAACTGCHEQYRETYKAKYGSGGGKGPVPVPVPAQ